MKKPRIIIGLILNLLIVGGVGFAVSNAYWGFVGNIQAMGLNLFYHFGFDASIFLAFAGILAFIWDIRMLSGKKASRLIQTVKLIGVVASLITAGFAIGYLFAFKNVPLDQLYTLECYLLVYAIVPVLGIASFIVENQPRLNPWLYGLFGMAAPIIYGGLMVPLIALSVITVIPYEFLTIDQANIWVTVLWGGGFLIGSYILAVLILFLHNIGAAKKSKALVEEPVAEAMPVEEKKEELPEITKAEPEQVEEHIEEQPQEEAVTEEAPKPEPVTVLAPKTAYAHPKLRKTPTVRTYHVTKQPSGQWQVKLANSNKAIKLFPTQREAIAYARGLVESRGGSYRIHSVKGKIRS